MIYWLYHRSRDGATTRLLGGRVVYAVVGPRLLVIVTPRSRIFRDRRLTVTL